MLLTSVDTNTLPGLSIALADRGRNAVGALGEKWAQMMLEKSGYCIRPAGVKQGDFIAISETTGEITRVEVKTARQGRDGKWRFLLWKAGEQDHRHADVVVFLAVKASGYVVPFITRIDEIAGQKTAVISSDPLRYRGRLAPFRQRNHRLTLPTVVQ